MLGGLEAAFRAPRWLPSEALSVTLRDPRGERALWLSWAREGASRVGVTALSIARAEAPRCARRTFGAPCLQVEDPWRLRLGRSTVDGTHTRGSLVAGDTSLAWDLRLEGPPEPPYAHPGSALRALRGEASHEGRVALGAFTVDGVEHPVQRWAATMTLQRSLPVVGWRALAVGFDDDPHGHFEAVDLGLLGAPVGFAGLSFARLLHRGRWLRFEGPAVTNRREVGSLSWRFGFSRGAARLSGEVTAEPFEAAGLQHENPGGRVTCALHGLLAACRLELSEGERPATHLRARGCSLEVRTPDAAHGLLMVG
ncbi:MAG: hypothetical protein HY909_26210 [Deltaproteobacteria bacterium]|nr:hypothetical protein [Deltaproteobacteria bacterium]